MRNWRGVRQYAQQRHLLSMRTLLFVLCVACSRTPLVLDEEVEPDPCAPCTSACFAKECVTVSDVVASGNTTCVRFDTRKVACWGSNESGVIAGPVINAVPVLIDNVLGDEIALSDTHA